MKRMHDRQEHDSVGDQQNDDECDEGSPTQRAAAATSGGDDGPRSGHPHVGVPRLFKVSPIILATLVGVAAAVAAGIGSTAFVSTTTDSEACWEARAETDHNPGTHRHRHILPPKGRSKLPWWRKLVPRRLLLRPDRNETTTACPPHDHYFPTQANLTLRQILSDPTGYHLAMAPAFFGFYGYFGALAAWEEAVGRHVLEPDRLLSVAGASAGAMTAVLLASQIPPQTAASFVSDMTLDKFADFPGILAAFRGNKFEAIMENFLRQHSVPSSGSSTRIQPATWPPQMQDSRIPVAVSAFDIQSLSGQILRTGSMARAARASATFPFLFQPVGYHVTHRHRNDTESVDTTYLLIDGGLTDFAGLQGTKDVLSSAVRDHTAVHTIINLSVGDFLGSPPGPAYFVDGVNGTVQVVSVSIQHLPACGPWAMSNGPIAVEAALKAMLASLDVQLFRGREPNHYELHIDTRGFWKQM